MRMCNRVGLSLMIVGTMLAVIGICLIFTERVGLWFFLSGVVVGAAGLLVDMSGVLVDLWRGDRDARD